MGGPQCTVQGATRVSKRSGGSGHEVARMELGESSYLGKNVMRHTSTHVPFCLSPLKREASNSLESELVAALSELTADLKSHLPATGGGWIPAGWQASKATTAGVGGGDPRPPVLLDSNVTADSATRMEAVAQSVQMLLVQGKKQEAFKVGVKRFPDVSTTNFMIHGTKHS